MRAIFTRFKKPKRCCSLRHEQINGYLLACASLVLLAAIVFDAASGHSDRLTNPVLFTLATIFTRFGESDWCLVISIVLALEASAVARLAKTARQRCHALFMSSIGVYAFLSIALSGLAANILKRAIGRARPDSFVGSGPLDFDPFAGSAHFESFPSGHATTIGAVFMIAALLAPKYRLPFAVAALWFGMTRVMVGAHYPSDVVAGLCFGAGFTWVMARVFASYGLVFRLDPSARPILRQRLQKVKTADTENTVGAEAKEVALRPFAKHP